MQQPERLRAILALVSVFTIAFGGLQPLAAAARRDGQEAGRSAPVSRLDLDAIPFDDLDGQRPGLIDVQDVYGERARLVGLLAALERAGRPQTDRGRRIAARLKRVLAILEIPGLPARERAERFEQVGVSRFYRGQDLVVRVRVAERTVRALGAPVHPAPRPQGPAVPDGASAPGTTEHEWEQDWEDAQIDAEDTIVAIEALVPEAEGWISDLQGYSGLLQESDAEAVAGDLEGGRDVSTECTYSETSDVNSEWNCGSAVAAGIAEAFAAIGAYLENSAAVQAALSAARNSVTVALASFTAGTLTVAELAAAATGAITGLVGSSAGGWFLAAAAAVATGIIVYEIYDNCFQI